MNYAMEMVDEDERCALEEPSLGVCPLCKYQDDNIIQKMNDIQNRAD